MMQIVDLTHEISNETPVFHTYVKPMIRDWTTLDLHGFRSKLFMLVEHTATHVDATAHFIKDGEYIDQEPLDHFFGPAVLLDLRKYARKNHAFSQEEISNAEKEAGVDVHQKIVLLWTAWDAYWGKDEFWNNPGLSKGAAEYFKKKKVKAVAADIGSMDTGDSTSFPAHHTLLGAGINIFESLTNLSELSKREFLFSAVPLKIRQGTASPVRAIAVTGVNW